MDNSGQKKGVRTVRKKTLVLYILLFLFIFCYESYAFFPTGGYDAFNVLRLARWPFYEFDTNNDGNINGWRRRRYLY